GSERDERRAGRTPFCTRNTVTSLPARARSAMTSTSWAASTDENGSRLWMNMYLAIVTSTPPYAPCVPGADHEFPRACRRGPMLRTRGQSHVAGCAEGGDG